MNKLVVAILFAISITDIKAQDTALINQPFMLPAEDVFSITGRGTVVVGKIERGRIKTGDSVEIIGLSQAVIKSRVNGIEAFRKLLDEAKTGDNVGLLLSGVTKDQVQRGMMICKPGSVKAYTSFTCQVQLLTKDEGGRSTPVFDKYRPQFVFYTATVSGEITLPAGSESLAPGATASVSVKLSEPAALLNNMEFLIREGGRTVGKGKITGLVQ